MSAYVAGASWRMEPRDEMERHVDPGRHACGGDDVSVVDEAILRPDHDSGSQPRERVERAPVRRRRAAVEQA
jgi:hypothetical protein